MDDKARAFEDLEAVLLLGGNVTLETLTLPNMHLNSNRVSDCLKLNKYGRAKLYAEGAHNGDLVELLSNVLKSTEARNRKQSLLLSILMEHVVLNGFK